MTQATGSMREEVRRALVAAVPAFGGRVYQPSAPALKPNVAKPFAVIRLTTLAEDGDWESRRAAVSVWLGVDRGSYAALDELAIDVEHALDNLRLTDADGRGYILRYVGSTVQEGEDPAYDALIRAQSYAAERLDWLRPLGAAPDPVAGLAGWTASRFPFVGVDPTAWDPRDASPGVYWRLDRGQTLGAAWDDPAPNDGWVVLTLRGHVLAESADARLNLTRRILSALTLVGGRYLTLAPGTPAQTDAWLEDAAMDARADPYADGQLAVRLRLPALVLDDVVPFEPGPLMRVAHVAYDAMDDGTVDLRADIPRPPLHRRSR